MEQEKKAVGDSELREGKLPQEVRTDSTLRWGKRSSPHVRKAPRQVDLRPRRGYSQINCRSQRAPRQGQHLRDGTDGAGFVRIEGSRCKDRRDHSIA